MNHAPLLLMLAFAACSVGVDPNTTETALPSSGGGGGGGGGGGTQETIFFSIDLLPLFQSDCIHCHGGAGGLDLQSYAGVIAGGDSGAVVIPGDGDASLLVRRLDGRRPPVMPLDGLPLTAPEIDRIRTWIDEGARDN